MNTIIVKINDATQTITQVQVITKDGIPTVITATDKVNYEFFDTAINHAPNHIITKRLKNDLYVSFEEAGVESDLIIEGFYDHTDSALLGVAEDGEYYYYIPDTGETYDYVTQLEVGDVEGQALGGEEYIAAAILPWWIPAAAGIGLVGLIAGRNSDDDNDNDNAPIAENDTVLGESSQPVIIDVVANDSDAENDLDPKTVKLIDPITGDAVTSFAVDGEGAWAVDATTGEVSFTPETGFTADPTPVSYVVSDINGLQSNQATITIDYPQNAPVAEDDTALGETGQPVTIDVVANDSDAENDLDPTTVGLIDPVSSDEVTTVTVAGEGTWDVDPTTGEVSFTPESGFTADPTPVSYVVSDINGLQSNQAVITANYPLIVSIAGTESLNETTADGSMSEANYTINLSKPSNEDTVITITIGDGSTEGSEDYTAPVTQYVTIPAGQTSVDITVPINDDNVFEGPEDFTVTITEVISGIATVGLDNNSVTTTIYDDGTTDGSTLVDATDPSVGNDTPTVSISGTRNLSETAVDGSANEAIYTVSLSNPSTEDTVVTIVISDGSTEGSADYTTPVTQDVTIPAGQNSVDIAVPINDDNVFEGPEDFTVTVAAVTSGTATIGTDNVTVNTTIYDDGTTDGSTPIDPNNPILGGDKPVVDITAIKSEAIEGVSNGLVFEVSQNNLSEFPTTVDVKLANSTIEAVDIASINYTDLNGTVVFLDNIADIQAFLDEGVQVNIPVGSITAPVITFTVVDDAVYEQSESIVLEISNPMNATIGTASDSGTIFDQSSNSNNPGDGSDLEGDKPILSVGNTSAIEGGDLIHSISLSNPTQADVIYTFALSGDSAIEGMDFTNTPVFSDGVSYDPVTGTITIPAGVTDFTVSYPTTADSIAESDETTTLTIDGISGTGTIFENNDRPILNINASTAQATEGAAGDIVFTIDQVGLSDTATSVILTLDLQDVDADDIDTIALTNTDGSIQTITVAEAIAGVSVSIPAGTAAEDMPSIAVTPTDDDIFEISEMLEMSISNPVNAIIGTNSDIGVILDEDGIDGTLQVGDKPTVSIAATDGQAIEGLDNTLAFSVTQDNLSNFDTNVTINLSDISSIDATDIASISYTNGTGMAVTLSTTAQIQDFISNGDTVTIPAGSMVAPAIIITVVDDAIYEVSETFSMSISSPVNATIGTASDSATILDEDATDGTVNQGDKPSVTVSDAAATEGDTLVHSVTINGVTEADVTYDFALTNGTATDTDDYSSDPADLIFSDGVTYDPVSGTITVPAGVTDFTVSYPTLNDAVLENNETTSLTIGSGTGADTGTGTISDAGDAIPVVSIDAITATATEGAGDSLVFAISQTGDTDLDSTVTATLVLGDIAEGDIDNITLTDATGTQTITTAEALAGVSVTIPAGSTVLPTFTITPLDDATYEVSETFSMSISSPVNATIGTASDVATIFDEDATDGTLNAGDKPSVSITATDATAIEGIDNVLSYTVSQDNLSNLDTTVQVAVDPSSDIEAADIASIVYTNTAGDQVTITGDTAIQDVLDGTTVLDVNIPTGSTAAPAITVTTVNDDVYENSEQLSFLITGADNADIDSTIATGTVLDESDNAADPSDGSNTEGDKPVAIVTGDSVTEGDSLEFTVDLSNVSESATTVALTLANGTAVLGTDTSTPVSISLDGGNTFSTVMVATDGTFSVNVPANSTDGIIVRVPTADDNIDEPDETITLTASATDQVMPSTTTGTIVDNDAAPVVSIVGATVVDEDAGTVTYTVSLTNPSSTAVTVDYATSNGTATAGADYTASSGTLTFAAGEVTKTVTVAITDDTLFENSENYTIALSNPSLNASIDNTQASVTTAITDNNTAPTISIDDTDAATTPQDNSVVEGTGNTINGAINISNLQSVTALTINNTDVTTATVANPVIINGSEGQLVITGYNSATGALTYTYTEDGSAETHNTAGDNVLDQFTVSLTNSAGSTSSDTLDIRIIDTAPVANPDTNSLTEETDKVTGNVLTATGAAATDAADSLGADATLVTAVESVTSTTVVGTVGGNTQGDYGVLSLNADGSYSYDLDNDAAQYLAIDESLTETFNYTITDADGDTSTTTLTVTINGTNDRPVITNVANGNNIIETAAAITEQADDVAITRTGTISFTDTDDSDEPTISEISAENIYVYDPNNSTFTNANPLTAAQKAALSSIFTADNDSGSFDTGSWSINAAASVIDFIPEGETITIRYAVQVDDNEGVTTVANGNEISTSNIRYVEVTITGTDDGIALVDDINSTNEDATLSVTAANGIFANDTADPDVNTEFTVDSYTVDGMAATFSTGAANPVTIDGVTIGELTINTDGSYTFEPAANFSGTVPVVTISVSNGPNAATPESGTETLTITVNPVSDAPDIGSNKTGVNEITTDEDTTVALGLTAPVIADSTDLSSNTDDSPERIGLITLADIPNGATLNYGGNNSTDNAINADGNPITIFLTDSDIFLNGITDASADYSMTIADFEAMTLTPAADDATNISFEISVTEYEVDNNGDIAKVNGSDVDGAESTVTIDIDVQAVTDTSGNNQSGDNFSEFGYQSGAANVTGDTLTATVNEGEYIDLPITTNFGDLINNGQNRETYGFVISGLQPDAVVSFTEAGSSTATEYTADSNGQVLLGTTTNTSDDVTATDLRVRSSSEPQISIKSADYNSQDMESITVSLYTQDHDRDSDLDSSTTGNQRDATVELISTVTVDMTVTPVAGQVTANDVTTIEDNVITLDDFGFTVSDTQNGAGAETITEISFVLPEGWTYNDGGSPVVGAVGGTTITISGITANDNLDLDTYLQDFSITPPAQSSTDADFAFTVTTSDTDDDGGSTVSNTTTLDKTVTITPVAEVVGSDTDGDGTDDLTLNPDHVYIIDLNDIDINADEDLPFALNYNNFDLEAGWSNQDTSEDTYAHMTFGNKDADSFISVVGAVFTYNNGAEEISLTDNGDGVDIPIEYLDTVTITGPEDYSDYNLAPDFVTAIKVEAKTQDFDEDTNAMVEATSGESFLTFTVKGVADVVSLGVDPATGFEDQAIINDNERATAADVGDVTTGVIGTEVTPEDGIALNIRPSSRDNDGSEVYNVTINDIPVGAQLYVDDGGTITLLDTSSGSVTISDYTNVVDNLYFVSAENYSGTVNLKVSTVSVESDGDVSAPSAVLNLPIRVFGQADLILNDELATVDVNGTAYTYTIAEDVLDNSNLISLSAFFDDASAIAPYDGDIPAAEQVTYKVTGVPDGFDIAGAVFLGGSGDTRSWSVSLESLQDGTAQLVTPDNFAGEVDFTITGTTTETVSGNSATHNTQTVSVVVTPDAADGVVNDPQVLAVEDTWTTVNFLAAFVSSDTTDSANSAIGYEALETITIKADDLIGIDVALRVDGTEVPLVAGETYVYTPDQLIEIMYDDDKRHSDDNVTIPFDYTYTDTASLADNSTISSTSITGNANIDVTFQAVTDAPSIGLDVTDNSIIINSNNDNNSAEVIVSLSSDDQDNTESFTRLEITDVPDGVIVEGGILSGGTWYVDVIDTEITDTAPTYTLQLTRDPNTANIPEGDFTVTVTGITQDINGDGLNGSEARVSDTFVINLDRDGTGVDPVDPELIATLEPGPSLSQTEDGTVILSDVINATLEAATATTVSSYSFSLTDLPDGVLLSSANPAVTVQEVGGQWLVSVDDANGLTPNDALAAVTLTPPVDFSTNDTTDTSQDLSFGVEFTALNNVGLETSTDIDVSVEIKPITDPINNDGETTTVSTDEDTPVAITIDLTNDADGDYVSLVDGKLYLQLDESGLTNDKGTTGALTDDSGTALVEVTLVDGQVDDIPAGTYYVLDVVDTDAAIDGINPADSITVNYTPAENEDGTATINVYAAHTEVNSISGHDSGTLTYKHSYDVAVAAQPDNLSIAYDAVDAVATGDEDTKIAIDYKINVVDENDSAAAITLDEVPNGYLVYYTNTAGDVVLASNNGDSDGNGNNSWSIDTSKLENVNSGAAGETDNIFIAPPENISGVVEDIEMTVINNNGMASDPLMIDLNVTPVADDIDFNPTAVLGSQGKWTSLNLNADMVDIDGSETVNVILTGTNLYGNVLDVKTKSGTILNSVTFDAATSTYTIIGVTPTQLNDLLIKGGAPYNGTLQISLQTVESANNDTLTTAVQDIDVDVGSTLVFNGTTEDDVLISVDQTSAVTYSGGDGNDTFIGGSGKDTLNGDAGDDTLTGNAGNDTITGGGGNDTIDGGAGNDTLNGGADDDTIDGGAGNDTINGGAGDDVINGGAGNDTIGGGVGADTIDGGAGDDTIVFDADDLVINGGDGSDTLLIDEAGTSIDFSGFDSSVFESIETIDMLGNGAQSLTNLSTSDVLEITDSNNQLFVDGNNSDTVSLTSEFEQQTTSDQAGYDLYQSTADSSVSLYIDTDITTTVI